MIIQIMMIVQLLNINLSTQETYISDHLQYAKKCEKMFCVPAYLALAQAILESGYGTSKIAQEANNHFGIKWYKWCGHDYHQTVKNGSKWRCYESPKQSYLDYGMFLEIHTKLPNYKRDEYKKWCYWVARTGYAGRDRKKVIRYKQNLIKIIEQYKLNEL